jgi:hypothetical protein
MSNTKPQKIVYLFGAGSTHAEKLLERKIRGTKLYKDGSIKDGLLARDVSKRVIDKLLKDEPKILNDHGITESSLKFSPWGAPYLDIELFISLLEMIKTDKSEKEARVVRRYFREDITNNLFIGEKLIIPRLCSSLIEWHDLDESKEKLVGFLTLNYDSTLEESFKIKDKNIDYGFDVRIGKPSGPCDNPDKEYLLKLHGSFDWRFASNDNEIIISSIRNPNEMQWIPPGLNKEYLNYPYNIIHGKAYELLRQCNILRVIGCSLSQNDLGLISLLFKTQKPKRSNPYSIEIIDGSDKPMESFKRLGMFLSFSESFYESYYVKDKQGNLINKSTNNPFLDWLHYIIINTPNIDISKTKYLKKVEKWVNL